MGRKAATLWHATFSIAAGVLYFFFVLPRWPELMGDTSHALGTAVRIVAGVLIALAALPVVFTLLRARKPEYGTPQLALTLQTSSIVAHVLAGVLIVGTAISEIWLNLDTVGQWLFGVYGAAAAIALLGIFGFYLSFIAELPPPPPKPTQAQEREAPSQIGRRKKDGEANEAEDAEDAEDTGEAEDEDSDGEADEAAEADGDETTETPDRHRPARRGHRGRPLSIRRRRNPSRRPKRRPPWKTPTWTTKTPTPPSRPRADCATGARPANRQGCTGAGERAAVFAVED